MKKKEQRFLEIAQEAVSGLETLETRNSDSFDFFEIAVWNFKEALEKAYALGREDEKRAQARKAVVK